MRVKNTAFGYFMQVCAKKKNNDVKMVTTYNFKSVFNSNQAASLAEYIKIRARMAYGLTRQDTRKCAYDFAVANHLEIPKQWTENRRAGEEWLKLFRKRHPDTVLRKPEACSLSRATSFNPHNGYCP